MTWQYAGAYLVSIVTSPVIDLVFVVGVVVGIGVSRLAFGPRRR